VTESSLGFRPFTPYWAKSQELGGLSADLRPVRWRWFSRTSTSPSVLTERPPMPEFQNQFRN